MSSLNGGVLSACSAMISSASSLLWGLPPDSHRLIEPRSKPVSLASFRMLNFAFFVIKFESGRLADLWNFCEKPERAARQPALSVSPQENLETLPGAYRGWLWRIPWVANGVRRLDAGACL